MQTMNTLGMRVLTDGALASTVTAPLRPSATVLTTTVYSTPDWIWVMLKLYTLCKKQQQTNKQTNKNRKNVKSLLLFENYQQLFYQASSQSQSHVCFVPLYCLKKHCIKCDEVVYTQRLFRLFAHKYLCLIYIYPYNRQPKRLAV